MRESACGLLCARKCLWSVVWNRTFQEAMLEETRPSEQSPLMEFIDYRSFRDNVWSRFMSLQLAYCGNNFWKLCIAGCNKWPLVFFIDRFF